LSNFRWNILADADPGKILKSFEQITEEGIILPVGLYGNGDAGSKIVDVLIYEVKERSIHENITV